MIPLKRTAFLAGTVAFFGLTADEPLAQGVTPLQCLDPAFLQYDCYPNGDIDPSTDFNDYDSLYSAYAEFAWQDFLALNFPWSEVPGETGPSHDNGLNYAGGKYVTVWETYTEARDIFLPDGATPPAFGSGHVIPSICQAAQQKTGRTDVTRVLSRTSKSVKAAGDGAVLDEYIQANRMGPVVDLNGEFVRFEISFNEEMYDYIVGNALYTTQGQEALDTDPNHAGNVVQWPVGVYNPNFLAPAPQTGAIMLKASWKILGAGDDPSLYHRLDTWIYNEGGGAFGQEPTVQESCELKEVGLIGLHIVHRTNSTPQWVWATFEHKDNAPWLSDMLNTGIPSQSYAFFDPTQCTGTVGGETCPINRIPPHPWNPADKSKPPTQMVRIGAPGRLALSLNELRHGDLQNFYGAGATVWENYFLVDVQFPTITKPTGTAGLREINPAYPNGVPTPSILANSTMETYIQGFGPGETTSNGDTIPAGDQMQTVGSGAVDPWNASGPYTLSGGAPRNSSSCIGCHGDGALTTGGAASFVFSLSRAESAIAPTPGEKGKNK